MWKKFAPILMEFHTLMSLDTNWVSLIFDLLRGFSGEFQTTRVQFPRWFFLGRCVDNVCARHNGIPLESQKIAVASGETSPFRPGAIGLVSFQLKVSSFGLTYGVILTP